MLHAIWQDALVVFGHRGRVLDARTTGSFASTLFVASEPFETAVVRLHPPGRNQPLDVATLRIPVPAAGEAFMLRDWVPWRSLSASMGWFTQIAALARTVADRGLVVPALDTDVAYWQPIVTTEVSDHLARLTTRMPPVVGALQPDLEPWQITLAATRAFTDDAVRVRMYGTAIPDVAPGSRLPADVVGRRFLGALVGPEATVIARQPAEVAARNDLARKVAQWTADATARSPLSDLAITLRVVPPTELEDGDSGAPTDSGPQAPEDLPWLVEVLLSPAADPSILVALGADDDSADLLGIDRRTLERAVRAALRRLVALAPQLVDVQAGAVELDLDTVVSFLRSTAPKLEQAGIAVLLPAWWGKPTKASVTGVAVEAPVTPGGLDRTSVVTVNWKVALGDTPLTKDELARLSAAKQELVYLRGRWVAFDDREVSRVLAAMARRTTEPVGAVGLLRLAADPTVDMQADGSGWAADLLAGLPDERLEPQPEPPGFVGTLRPYQRRGLGWLVFLDRLGLGGCLADDMGLGKTAQLLALLAHERAAHERTYEVVTAPRRHNLINSGPGLGPTLVVCPLSVVRNWEREAARFVPDLEVLVHHGASRADAGAFIDLVAGHDVVITTYATASRDAALLGQVAWQRIVADEAQHVKNAATGAARALRSIPARQKLALTGTPIENRLSELRAICDLVNPGLLGTATEFREHFAVPIERNRNPERTEELRRLVQPFLLRRSKADRSLVPELPDKIEQVAWATLTREQAGLYQAEVDHLLAQLKSMKGLRNSIDRRGVILATLTRLKQICNHPAHFLGDGDRATLTGRSGKLARFDELIDDVLASDERALVFTQYRAMGDLLVNHLAGRTGLAAPFLHGGVSKARRDRMVDRFQSGEVGPILIVSLKAGGSGLNLTAASHVIHYDRWWNPAVENQASDRAWRIGQTRTVLVNKLVCQGTIEERVDELITAKRDLADRVVGMGEAWLTELSTDEIVELVSLRPGARP